MHKSKSTPEDQVAASVESLKDSLRISAHSAPDDAKGHAEQLVEIGKNFLEMPQRQLSESYAPRPHKLSLSVSLKRIVHRLKVMALAFVVYVVLSVIWNAVFR